MFGISFYLFNRIKAGAHRGFLIAMALILGGAIGNVIDSIFYGVYLNNAPLDSPYKWFHGQVIDMLFFPIFEFYWPNWVPVLGGDNFVFFSPVFNIADSSIFVGVMSILIFQRRFFKDHDIQSTPDAPGDQTSAPAVSTEETNTIRSAELPGEENQP